MVGTNGENSGDAGEAAQGGFDRRTLIKRAAATGAVVWTAPLVMGSLASPAAAATIAAGCWKYQYNWSLGPTGQNMVNCINSQTDPNQVWNDPCAPSLPQNGRRAGESDDSDTSDRYKSNSCSPNRNCCHIPDGSGGQPDWWDGNPDGSEAVPTWELPACIIVTSSKNGCSQTDGFRNGDWIQFEIDHQSCPNCYFADPAIMYTDSTNCSSQSCDSSGDSDFFNGVRYIFTKSDAHYPVYFKAWIACNLNWNDTGSPHGSFVPNTQCDLPVGEPGADPGHTKGVNGILYKSL